jgi:hypothetical protein
VTLTQRESALSRLLRSIPPLVALIDAALLGLSATLVRDRLIPENVGVISTAAVLLIVVGFLATIAYRGRLETWFRGMVGTALAALAVLVVLHLNFVHTVEPYGADAGAHQFLVGYQLTPEGSRWADTVGVQSTAEFIAAIGHDRIGRAWGTSFGALRVLYTLMYLLFVLTTVLAIGGAQLVPAKSGGKRRQP